MSYSSVRTDEQFGTHPSIHANYNEVIISVTPVWDSAMNNTRWFICYGTPFQQTNQPVYNNESNLQVNINNLQFKVIDLQFENDQLRQYTNILEKFVDENDLRSTFERKIQEERIKKELSMNMDSSVPCAPPEDHYAAVATVGTVSSY